MIAWRDKIKALVLLKENDFNVRKTAKQVGVNYNTIVDWKKKYSEQIYKDLDEGGEGLHLNETYDAALTIVAEEIKSSHEDFISEVLKTKIITIERTKLLVKQEKDLSKVTSTLKILHEITNADTLKDDKGKADTYIAFLTDVYNLKNENKS